ncbi:MAG: phosphoribosylanthranilate isomerase [Bacteroidota bacterium]
MKRLLWKVCGMREPENIRELIEVGPDFIGFIFYDKSSRFVGESDNIDVINSLPPRSKKVGVFVNEAYETLLQHVKTYGLDFVQLHGGESPQYCKKVKDEGIKIIKVFSVGEKLDMDLIRTFDGLATYFLFDTKTPKYGGSGVQFDWTILKDYDLETPYFLSGGIGIEDIQKIDRKDFPGLTGLDVNSRFEIEPGLKNITAVKELKNKITSNKDSYESIS